MESHHHSLSSSSSDPWSVGKYAKRSAIIHLNSDAQAQTVAVVGEPDAKAITGVSADGLTITLEDAFAPAAEGYFLRVVSDTGTEFRELSGGGNGANDVNVAAGNLFANIANGALQNGTYKIYSKGFQDNTDQSNVNFTVDIPNIIGYPEHNRCLAQVLSISTAPLLADTTTFVANGQVVPVVCGVELSGVGVHNSFTNNHGYSALNFTSGSFNESHLLAVVPLENLPRAIGNAGRSYVSNRSILDDGVLIGSPFGSRLGIKLLNMTTNEPLVLAPGADAGDGDGEAKNNPVHIVLRLLFLDRDEVPER